MDNCLTIRKYVDPAKGEMISLKFYDVDGGLYVVQTYDGLKWESNSYVPMLHKYLDIMMSYGG